DEAARARPAQSLSDGRGRDPRSARVPRRSARRARAVDEDARGAVPAERAGPGQRAALARWRAVAGAGPAGTDAAARVAAAECRDDDGRPRGARRDAGRGDAEYRIGAERADRDGGTER